MYIYIYIYLYCIYIYRYRYVYICVCIYIYLFMYVHVCVHICMYAVMYVCVYERERERENVLVYAQQRYQWISYLQRCWRLWESWFSSMTIISNIVFSPTGIQQPTCCIEWLETDFRHITVAPKIPPSYDEGQRCNHKLFGKGYTNSPIYINMVWFAL